MKHLFYFYSCFNPSFMGELIDEAIELLKNQENEVLFVYCGGINEMCLFNRGGSRPLCSFCSYCTKKVLKSHNIKCVPLTAFLKEKTPSIVFDYKSARELRFLKYRDANIGFGLMSGYISATRNMHPLIDDESRNYFDAHLAQDARMVDAIYNLIDHFNPDAIHSFNGRYEEIRPIWDICHILGLKCYLYEGTQKGAKRKKVIFEDYLPHDIKTWARRRDYAWEHYDMSESEKIELGKSFFENRRNGIYAGDKIYIKDQKKGNVPPIDKSKMNIGIMNSSEDEIASLGAEWDTLRLFQTQIEGITFMLENADPSIHFYLRIHPNLKKIKYRYHTDLLLLDKKYNNITVIPADSDVSTYDLLDHMDKIVCFGSTMGMESTYWNVPAILLGAAGYYYDGICYIPKNKDELKKLLSAHLKPLFNDSLYRSGAILMDKSPLVISDKNIEYQSSQRKIGKLTYHVSPFISFFVNSEITAFVVACNRYILGSKLFKRYIIPLKEEQ